MASLKDIIEAADLNVDEAEAIYTRIELSFDNGYEAGYHVGFDDGYEAGHLEAEEEMGWS